MNDITQLDKMIAQAEEPDKTVLTIARELAEEAGKLDSWASEVFMQLHCYPHLSLVLASHWSLRELEIL